MHTLKVNIAFHRNRESFKSLMPTKQRNGAHEKIMKVHLKACCSIALSGYCIASGRIYQIRAKVLLLLGQNVSAMLWGVLISDAQAPKFQQCTIMQSNPLITILVVAKGWMLRSDLYFSHTLFFLLSTQMRYWPACIFSWCPFYYIFGFRRKIYSPIFTNESKWRIMNTLFS